MLSVKVSAIGSAWPHGRFAGIANKYRQKLIELYGEAGRDVKYAEAFEVCEYGRQPSDEELKQLFPMLGQ